MITLVPFYYYVDNVTHVEINETEQCENKKASVSYRIVPASITSRVRKGSKPEERRLCQMVDYQEWKTAIRETGAMIILASNIETMLRELSYTDYLQKELDYANKIVFKNFRLCLVMEEIGDK